jgi:hypothetical protein
VPELYFWVDSGKIEPRDNDQALPDEIRKFEDDHIILNNCRDIVGPGDDIERLRIESGAG